MKNKTFYRRNLPHLVPMGGTFFVTSNLKDALPYTAVQKTKGKMAREIREIEQDPKLRPEEKEMLIADVEWTFHKKIDRYLHQVRNGPHHLKNPEVAQIVMDKLFEYDHRFYELIAFTIMSNHIHLLIDTSYQITSQPDFREENYVHMSKIMQRIKGGSGFLANRLLGREGNFWMDESFDRLIRNRQQLINVINYILQNPVKPGLVKRWEDWPFNYVAERYRQLVRDAQ